MKTLLRCILASAPLCFAVPLGAQKQHKTVSLPPALPSLSPEAQLALDELSPRFAADGLSRSQAPFVGNGPGAIAFNRMPCGPHSEASDFVMILRPAFDIALGTVNGPPFQIHVVRIEMTLAFVLPSIQRLPQASVT